MELYNLKINHLTNPLGFMMKENPVVSFKVKNATGKKLQSVRITVAIDEKLENIVFSSGQITNIQPAYPLELALQPRTRYYYQVEAISDSAEIATAIGWFETGKMNEEWQAEWITLQSQEIAVPTFCKDFELTKEIIEARIYIGCAGIYDMQLNGEKVGTEYLTPYSNDYHSWMQIITHDVTHQLQKGENTLKVTIAPGWYRGRFGLQHRSNIYGDTSSFIIEMHIKYNDGTSELVVSDDTWHAEDSVYEVAQLYDGEVLDFTKELDEQYKVAIYELDKSKLTDRLSLPVIVKEERMVEALITTPKGELLLDLGQNMPGWLQIDTSTFKDKDFKIQYCEVLDADGNFYNDNLRTAKAEFVYKTDGKARIVEPKFTYYGFRYAKIEGLETVPTDSFKARVVYSDLNQTGVINTSNPLVNRLFLNALWGQKDNFVDVPTDCPQRDERLGWTGDAQVFCGTANYNMNSTAFFTKYMYDIWQEQQRADGIVPFFVPSFGNSGGYGSAAWGDAATIIPWTCYLHSGDKTLLEKQYPSMKAWVEHIRSQDTGTRLWDTGFHLGDWLALDNVETTPPIGLTPPHMVASAYYLYSVTLLAKASKALGKITEQAEYEQLASEIKNALQKEYLTETGRVASDTQTANIITLYMDFATNPERVATMLNDKILGIRGGHLNTGFVGTAYICRVLSDHGFNEAAYKLLLNKGYPSWLHAVEKGATTIWERWDSIGADGRLGSVEMNSFNHYAYGSVMEWMYRNVAGLKPLEEGAGFKKVQLAPQPSDKLEWVNMSYDSPSGLYRSEWRINKDSLNFVFEIPFGGEAELTLPDAPDEVVINGEIKDYFATMRLEAGTYEISYQPTRTYYNTYTVNDDVNLIKNNPRLMEIITKHVPAISALPEHALFLPHEGDFESLLAKFGIHLEAEVKIALDAELAEIRTWDLV